MSEKISRFANEEEFRAALTAKGGLELGVACEEMHEYAPNRALLLQVTHNKFSAVLAMINLPLEVYLQLNDIDSEPMYLLKNTENGEDTFDMTIPLDQFGTVCSVLAHLYPKINSEDESEVKEKVVETT